MKKLIIIISLIHLLTTVQAQNPYLADPVIEETPINLGIDSFTNMSFVIGNSTLEAMNNFATDPLTLTISLIKVQPSNLLNPASTVTGASWFSVQYFAQYNMYYLTQTAPIPAAFSVGGSSQKITFNVKVTQASPASNKTNGFAVNIQPPGYANGPNTTVDDNLVITTFTTNEPILLPVELVSFYGSLNNCNTDLVWETASELNNDYFSVQKSINGIEWDEIAQVKGSGNSSTPQTYNYTDVQSNTGIIYYRLVQYDFDGRNDLSNVISVNGQGCDGFEFKLYPNPTYEFVNIELNQFKEKYQYTIYSSKGDMVRTSNLLNATQRIYVGDLASGAYLMNLVSDTKQISQPFIIQK